MRYILVMRMTALLLVTLALSGCAGAQTAYESESRTRGCPLIVVESNQFEDAAVRDTRGVRIGYAPGLRRSSFQTCTLTPETAYLEIDPLAGTSYRLTLPVSPLGANTIYLWLARNPNHSYAEVW